MVLHLQPTKKYCYFAIPRALSLLAQKKLETSYLSEFYLIDFSSMDLMAPELQLDIYMDMDSDNKFLGSKGDWLTNKKNCLY